MDSPAIVMCRLCHRLGEINEWLKAFCASFLRCCALITRRFQSPVKHINIPQRFNWSATQREIFTKNAS